MATSKRPFVRSPFNYDRDAASRSSGIDCSGSRDYAQQQFKDECDINNIARRFGLTGLLPQNTARLPSYADFSEVFDFHTAMNAVRQAEESFARLPAATRARFGNSPQAFLQFCEDPANREEARSLGLLRSDAPPSAAAVAQAPSAESSPAAAS